MGWLAVCPSRPSPLLSSLTAVHLLSHPVHSTTATAHHSRQCWAAISDGQGIERWTMTERPPSTKRVGRLTKQCSPTSANHSRHCPAVNLLNERDDRREYLIASIQFSVALGLPSPHRHLSSPPADARLSLPQLDGLLSTFPTTTHTLTMRNLAGMRRWASSLTAGPPQVQPCCIRHPRPATHHHSASITTHHSFNQRPSSSLRSFSNLAPHSTSFSSPHAPAVSFSQAPTSPHVVPSTPFAFALLYRYPPHYAAEDDPTYLNKPFQFLLKLAQPQHSSLPPSSFSSSSAPLYHVHELTFFADLTTHDLERALVTHFPTLTSVQLVHNGQPLPPSTPIQSMFNSQPLTSPRIPHCAFRCPSP